MRNPSRAAWALCLPYDIGGEKKSFYPDFLIVRSDPAVDYVVDILEPHGNQYADNLPKAKALAEYAKAEEHDNSYSVANWLATLWQKHIDDGNKNNLPDLYIIQIAIGAQGVTEKYMWYPEREKKLIPGVLGKADISLFLFSEHIFSLLDDSFAKMNKDYEIIGLHWRGGENDVEATPEHLSQHLEAVYTKMFDTFNSILHNPPIVLHKLACPDRMNDMDPTGQYLKNMNYINSVFDMLQGKYKNISVFDVRNAPQYIPNVRGNGLFIADAVHFTSEVNRWVTDCIVRKYCDV